MGSDMISRQALLDAINEEIEYGEKHSSPENEQVNKGLRIARKLVKASPTIEAEPCTFCAYNPPSSCDGKPCTACPAHKRSDDSNEHESET